MTENSKIIPHPVTDRVWWLQWRRQAVNASEVAALFGCHPYQTAFALYQDKTSKAPRDIDNATLNSGRLLEPIAAERVFQERPEWGQPVKAAVWLHAPDYGMGATPDYYVTCPRRGRGVVQIKTSDPWAFKESWTDTLPPMWVILQTTQEMLLAQTQWAAIACMEVSRELPLHIYEFERNAGAEAKLIAAVAKFWDDVAAGREPQADYARDGDIIKAMYAKDNGSIADLTGNNRMPELLARHERLSDGIKTARAAEKELKAIETEIKAILGAALGATLPGWHVESPTISRKGYTVEPTTYRTLKIKRTAQEMEIAA